MIPAGSCFLLKKSKISVVQSRDRGGAPLQATEPVLPNIKVQVIVTWWYVRFRDSVCVCAKQSQAQCALGPLGAGAFVAWREGGVTHGRDGGGIFQICNALGPSCRNTDTPPGM